VIRRKRGQVKLKKEFCEICRYDNPAALNFHHIIPRCDPRCTNDNTNIAIICHICHDLIHAGEIIILGVYSSTAKNGRTLLWHKKDETPFLEERDWRVQSNPNVIQLKSLVK
jgi:hypothetical protein